MNKRRRGRRLPTTGAASSLTLLEQKPSVYNAVLEGVKLGLTYTQVAKSCGVHAVTLSGWMGRARDIMQQMGKLNLTEEEIDELAQITHTNQKEQKESLKQVEEKYGMALREVIEQEGFWLGFAYDLKRADVVAESRMLGVIRDAAIGNHELVETKRKSVIVRNPPGNGGQEEQELPGAEITTTTKQLRPQWQAAAWFLERKYPEKYAQRRIVQGELPPDIPYEVFMTAKTLLQLPKVELDRIVSALRAKMQSPRVASGPALLEGGGGDNGGNAS